MVERSQREEKQRMLRVNQRVRSRFSRGTETNQSLRLEITVKVNRRLGSTSGCLEKGTSRLENQLDVEHFESGDMRTRSCAKYLRGGLEKKRSCQRGISGVVVDFGDLLIVREGGCAPSVLDDSSGTNRAAPAWRKWLRLEGRRGRG